MAERWQQWMPHDIDAWQGSANVQALSDLAYRAVHNLLQDMWKQTDCALPLDDRELAKRSRVATRWAECRDEVLEYFADRTDLGKITHRVLLEKWNKARGIFEEKQMTPDELAELSAARSAAGKKGNEKRWNHRKPIASASQTSQTDEVAIAKDRLTGTGTETETEQKQKPSRDKREFGFEIPEWVDRKALDRFMAMRKKNRKPVMDDALPLLVKKLESLRRAGHDPTAVLDQSTMNSWQGLFEVRESGKGSRPGSAEATLGMHDAASETAEDADEKSRQEAVAYWEHMRTRAPDRWEHDRPGWIKQLERGEREVGAR